MKLNWIKTEQSIVLNYDGETNVVLTENPQFEKIIEAIKTKNFEAIPELVSLSKHVEKISNGLFRVVNNNVFVGDFLVPDLVGKKILQFHEENLPLESLVEFCKKLSLNPSYRSVQQLYSFLEAGHFCITEDGDFIAYKKITKDFKDIRTGTFDNSLGQTVSMPRNQVNEDPEQTCSNGLHVCSKDYLQHYGNSIDDLVVEVLVNPSNVVAVPKDYSLTKMRVSEYKVLNLVKNFRTESFAQDLSKQNIYNNQNSNTEGYCITCENELTDEEYEMCDECYENDEFDYQD